MPRLTLPRLATLLVFIGIFAMAARPSVDSDTWWHLSAGEWMLAHGQILTQDVFSSTRLGQPWLNVYWLAQLGMAAAWNAAGYAGLNLLVAALVTVAFVFVYWQLEGNAYLKAFVLVLAAAASAIFWSARPQMASFVLASVFAWVLAEYRWRGRNRLWLLPLLMALWANLHGGFAIGFLLLGATLAGQVGSRLFGPPRAGVLDWRGIGWVAGVTALCAAAVVINPFGVRLYAIPFQTVSIGVLQNFIQEWQSPNFHLISVQVFLWLLLAAFGAVALGKRLPDLTELITLGGFTYLALLAARNISIVALMAAPLIARHLAAAVADWHTSRPRLAALLDPPPLPTNPRSLLLNWGLLAVVALAAVVKAADATSAAANEKVLAAQSPVGAADYLAQAQPAGPLFNAYNWGGYLMWRLYPQYPVFVDGRTDLYADELLSQYLNTVAGNAGYADLLNEHGINLVLVETGAPLLARLDQAGGWRSVYSDDMATIYQRVTRAVAP
jgi:hypothetical protein